VAVGDGVGLGDGVEVGDGVGVAVGVAVGVGLGVVAGVGDGVGAGVAVGAPPSNETLTTTPPDETLLGFYERAADGLLLPDTDRHLFVLYERGVPQSTVELCVSQHIVGLYAVATRPVARGRGYAATVAAEALRFARHVVRARSVVLQSNPRARPLYERIGLHAIGEFHQFVPEVSEAEWAG